MDIIKCIEDLKNLPTPKKTFMEIMKVHRSEVHMANLLAYFFRSEESHGLGSSFLAALFETNSFGLKKSSEKENESAPLFNYGYRLNPETTTFVPSQNSELVTDFVQKLSRVHVKTEELTTNAVDNQKRIDLLLTTDECVVCIEFKINHDLNNPLQTYQDHIKEIELDFWEKTQRQRDLFFIVLTPYKKSPSESVQRFIDTNENVFREMILSHFTESLMRNIPENYFIENFSNSNSQYLVDFIQTINNRKSRYYQLEILNDLKNHLGSGLKSDVLENRRCLQIHSVNHRFKIRIKSNRQFVLEKWSKTNQLEKAFPPLELTNANNYADMLNELNLVMREAG